MVLNNSNISRGVTASILLLGISGAFAFVPKAAQAQFTTQYPEAQMQGLGVWETEAIFTVGETVEGYTPTGILDGIGAFKKDDNTVRVFVNSELNAGTGYAYDLNTKDGDALNDVTVNGGARISYFDIDIATRGVVDGGLAFDRIFDRAGNLVTDTSQFTTGGALSRFCSGQHVNAGTFGFVDNLYFAGEEINGGTQFVLNADSVDSAEGGALWAVPAMGRGGWENVTAIDSGDPTKVALLLGDDREGAPLYLYVGDKNALNDGSFLDRNGLAEGTLYAWESDTGETTPAAFNGTGMSLTGNWVEILNEGPINGDDTDGFDALGYATQDGLDTQTGRAALLGNTIVPGLTTQDVFLFSRPEDLSTNPFNGSQAVMSSTGRSSLFPEDSWGTIYTIDVDVTNLTASLNILYDGDDAGNEDAGLRSPDNLDWADDGDIYVQEDRSFSGFCQTTGEEASIWKLDPTGGTMRIAQMDRSVVVPVGVTDNDPTDCGDWESSGILDVTELFDTKPGEKLFIFDVQAHSIRDGVISSENLVQGGQLVLMSNKVPEPGTVLGLGLFGLGAIAAKRKK